MEEEEAEAEGLVVVPAEEGGKINRGFDLVEEGSVKSFTDKHDHHGNETT